MNFRLHHLLFLIFLFSCDQNPVFDNPYDEENNPNYIPPETIITSESINGTILDTSGVTVAWEGNELVIEYSYKLDDNAWSEWSAATSVTLDYLDEGQHSFRVKGRYESLAEDDTPAELDFEVDAVQGPGLRVYPLLTEISINSSFDVYLYAEEVAGVVFAEIQMSYDPAIVVFSGYEAGNMLGDPSDNSILIVEDNMGVLDITLATNYTDQSGVSGTGSLVKLTFSAANAQGSTDLTVSGGSAFLDFGNNDITIADIENGLVVVE